MNWMIWDGIIATSAVIGIIISAVGAKKNQIASVNFFTILAAVGCAYLAYAAIPNGFIAVIAGYFMIMLLGLRWPEWVGQDRKFSRLIFWLIADLPVFAIVLASWVYWYTGWLTAAIVLAGSVVHIFMTNLVLKPIFPIIAQQQALVAARRYGQTDQINTLENELGRLEQIDHLKQILDKITRHQDLLAQAQYFYREKNLARATPYLQEIIRDLGSLPGLNPRQKSLLGVALLLRGKVHAQLKENDEAIADIEKSRQYIRLDEEAITLLAVHAIKKNDTSKKGIRYCLDFLALRKGQPENNPARRVKRFIALVCVIPPNLPAAELREKRDSLEQIVAASLDLPAAQIGLGQVLILMGAWAEGVEVLNKALKDAPQEPLLFEFLGRGYEALGNLVEAREAYEESLRLNSQQAEIGHSLGLIYLDGRINDAQPESTLDPALHWLGEAARLKPDRADYAFDLARAFEKSGNLTLAKKEVERCLALTPQSLPAHRLLGDLLFAGGDFSKALSHYLLVSGQGEWKDTDLTVNAAICMIEIGSTQEGLGLLAPMAESNLGVLIYTGQAHLKQKEYKEAARDLRHYIRSVRTSEEAEYFLGCALASLNLQSQSPNYREASNYFEMVIKRKGVFVGRAHLHIGKIYEISGDLDTSLVHYQACARQADTQLEAGLGLVRIYIEKKQLPEARAIIDFLVSKYSGNRPVKVQCARVAEIQGDLQQAQACYAALDDWGAQGVILFLQHKTDQAMVLLEKARAMGDQSDRVIYYCGLGRNYNSEFEGAIGEWNTLCERHPEDASLAGDLAQAWYMQGCKLINSQKYSQAAEAWEHALPRFNAEPRFVRALQQVYMLAAFTQLGKPESFRSIEQAANLGADPQMCLYWQAVSHLVQGDLSAGVAEMERYIKTQAADAQAQYNLGVALIKMVPDGEAAPHLEMAASTGKDALRQLAEWALAAEHAIRKDWKQVVNLTSGNGKGEMLPWQALLLVTALVQVGEMEQARLVAAQNQSSEAHVLLGAAYTTQGDSGEALKEYRQALQIDGQQGAALQGAAFILMSMAARHAANKEWKEAQACLKEARQLTPSDTAVLSQSEAIEEAAVLSGVSQENEEQAISILERLQKSGPCRIDYAHQLAIMNHRQAIQLESISQTGDCDPMWRLAIANWAVVLSADEYWQRWLAGRQPLYTVPIPPEEVMKLRLDGVTNCLKGIHTQFIQSYSAAGKEADVARHHRLSACLGLEINAARAMSETIRLLAQKGRPVVVAVASGPQFWGHFGLAQEVSQMADEALRIEPHFLPAQVIKEALLPTGMARALLEEAQVDEAIDLLKEYLAGSPEDSSAKALIASALITRLEAQINTDLDGALATWQEAKQFGAESNEAEKAIFYKDKLANLREVRVNTLNSQAVELTNDAGYDLQHNNPSSAIVKLRQARDLLNEAHGYDPDHAKVNQNLATVNQILGQVGS